MLPLKKPGLVDSLGLVVWRTPPFKTSRSMYISILKQSVLLLIFCSPGAGRLGTHFHIFNQSGHRIPALLQLCLTTALLQYIYTGWWAGRVVIEVAPIYSSSHRRSHHNTTNKLILSLFWNSLSPRYLTNTNDDHPNQHT